MGRSFSTLMLVSGGGEGFSGEVSQGEGSISQWVLMRSHKGHFLVMASGALTGRWVNLPIPQGRIQPKLGRWEGFKFSSCLPPAKQIHLGACLPSTNAVPVAESSSTPLTFFNKPGFHLLRVLRKALELGLRRFEIASRQ